MSESYQHVVKGGLKLKGGVPAAGGVKKKKKKKDKHKDVRGDARFRPVHDAHHRTFRAFHRALARLDLTSRLPSSATFAERERRRGAGRRGRRGRVRPSARGGHAHGGGAAVRRAGCEDPGKADSLDGEQVAPRQGEGLQRVPLQAQRAPRHSQGRTRMMTDVVFERKGETFSTTRRTRAQKRSEKRRRRRRARRALLCFPPFRESFRNRVGIGIIVPNARDPRARASRRRVAYRGVHLPVLQPHERHALGQVRAGGVHE